jgi:hypothetical protein
LLDTVDNWTVDVWLVFRDLPPGEARSWFWRLLKPGFQHVEVWQSYRQVWLRVEPGMEMAAVEAYETPPWENFPVEWNATVVRVQRAVPKHKLRSLFFVGPITCVELAKAFIGLNAPFVRTPHQLYKAL